MKAGLEPVEKDTVTSKHCKAQEFVEQEMSSDMKIIFHVYIYFGNSNLIIHYSWARECEVTKTKGTLTGGIQQVVFIRARFVFIQVPKTAAAPSTGFINSRISPHPPPLSLPQYLITGAFMKEGLLLPIPPPPLQKRFGTCASTLPSVIINYEQLSYTCQMDEQSTFGGDTPLYTDM